MAEEQEPLVKILRVEAKDNFQEMAVLVYPALFQEHLLIMQVVAEEAEILAEATLHMAVVLEELQQMVRWAETERQILAEEEEAAAEEAATEEMAALA